LLSLRKAALEHVVFVNVIERDKVAMRRGIGYRKKEEIRFRETANIRFIDWAEELYEQGTEVGACIVVGALVSEVIKAASEHGASMVVLGSSAKAAWVERWIGSIPREIAENSVYPTLLIPPEPE
jgi:nucleotide-binding universal stress UspA family protein